MGRARRVLIVGIDGMGSAFLEPGSFSAVPWEGQLRHSRLKGFSLQSHRSFNLIWMSVLWNNFQLWTWQSEMLTCFWNPARRLAFWQLPNMAEGATYVCSFRSSAPQLSSFKAKSPAEPTLRSPQASQILQSPAKPSAVADSN